MFIAQQWSVSSVRGLYRTDSSCSIATIQHQSPGQIIRYSRLHCMNCIVFPALNKPAGGRPIILRNRISIITRLKARLQPNIGNTLQPVSMVFARSGTTPAKVDRFVWSLSTLSEVAVADFERYPCSSESWRARRDFVFFCQVSNARFYQLSVGQISRNWNTTRRSVSRWILSEHNFESFPVKSRFATKPQKYDFFNVLRLRAATTAQWLANRSTVG